MIRSERHTGVGPVRFRLVLPAGLVRVVVDDDADVATVSLTGDGDAAAAVRDAQIRSEGQEFAVTVPRLAGSGGARSVVQDVGSVHVVQSFGRNMTVNGVQVHGTGDVVFVNGVQVSGQTVSVGGRGVLVEVRVPAGSAATISTEAASVHTTGVLDQADIDTGSGDVELDGLETAWVRTGSGDVQVGRAWKVQAKTGSGDIRIGRAQVVEAQSGAGDVRVREVRGQLEAKTGTGDIKAHLDGVAIPPRVSSGTGDITLTGAAGLDLSQVRSGTGQVRTR